MEIKHYEMRFKRKNEILNFELERHFYSDLIQMLYHDSTMNEKSGCN